MTTERKDNLLGSDGFICKLFYYLFCRIRIKNSIFVVVHVFPKIWKPSCSFTRSYFVDKYFISDFSLFTNLI